MVEYVPVASVDELEPGESLAVAVDGEAIAVFNVDGEFHAVGNACTHVGGPLATGALEGATVTCPWHGATFDVTSGEALSRPARGDLTEYAVAVRDGTVAVAL